MTRCHSKKRIKPSSGKRFASAAQREQFLNMYFGSSICDCEIVEKESNHPQWITPKKTITEHLGYKFIMALEGNDVASNLKWGMSSNSIAVMSRSTRETWFMEGTLIPNYHYIEIKDDLSNLEEQLTYYIHHPEEAQQIIDHVHEYVHQFMDEEREEIIQLLVMGKYFKMTCKNDILLIQEKGCFCNPFSYHIN